jgi:N-methylhydantoinase A
LNLPESRAEPHNAQPACKGQRPVYDPQAEQFQETSVYDRYRLQPGTVLKGPAIIEERESTVVVNGPATLQVDAVSNLVVDL